MSNEVATKPLPQAGNVVQLPRSASLSLSDSSGFAHLQRVAKVFNQSALVPDNFKGEENFPNCVIALDMAQRLGANPLAVMQHLYIVHGKPGWSSQWIIAAINSCGRFEPLRFDVTGKNDGRECVAWTVDKDLKLPAGVRTLEQAKEYDVAIYESPGVSIQMAIAEGWMGKNGSKWKTMPELMLRYRAATFFGRLYAPELLMGMKTVEEVIDIETEVIHQPEKQSLSDASAIPRKREKLPKTELVGTGHPEKLPSVVDEESALAEAGLAPGKAPDQEPAKRELKVTGGTRTERQPAPEPGLGEMSEIQKQVSEELATAGCTFEHFRTWAKGTGQSGDWDSIGGFAEIPEELARMVKAARRTVIPQIQKIAKGELL